MDPVDPTAAETADRRRAAPSDRIASIPVALTYAILAVVMTAFWFLGMRMNGDVDDLLKLHELRHFIDTRDVFDRTLPGILQPEPYVTHWPWIVDMPYAALAALLSSFLGASLALQAACLAVPLLLLAPALSAYNRIVLAMGFAVPVVVLPLASLFAIRGFFEFAPGRIDYHNLQILLCLGAIVLLLSHRRATAFANGLLVAGALAISLEFAAFHALIVAIHVFEFVFERRDGARRLIGFGVGLVIGAVALFAAIVPPSAYLAERCDAYAAPHLLVLVCGGLSLAIAPLLARGGGWLVRTCILMVMATATCLVVASLFPSCLNGPYGALSSYVRDNHLSRISQEKSLFARPDFVLSGSFGSMTVLFVGALAPLALSLFGRVRSRAVVILALFSLLALVQAILYFRSFRYLPFFAGLGIIYVLAAAMPKGSRAARLLGHRFDGLASPVALALPGLVLSVALGLYHLARPAPDESIPAAEFADGCDLSGLTRQSGWPAGARVMAPPNTGIQLLSLSPAPTVVAVPQHPSSMGIERAYRFLDPATADPQAVLAAAHATHVALCAWRSTPLEGLAERMPLTAALMEGRPPGWLRDCPVPASSPIRLYAIRHGDGTVAACPSSGTSANQH